jgi:hypothetical protein
LLIVGGVAAFRAFQPATVERGDVPTLIKFVGLVVALSMLAAIPVELGGS